MPNQIPLFNSDPNIQSQAALIQQRQALAQALMSQGMQPLDTGNRTVGGVGYRVSPFEGLGKLAQAYFGAKMLQDTTQQMGNLAAQQYANLLRQNAPQVQPSYSQDQVSGAAQDALAAGGQAGDQAPAYDPNSGSFTAPVKNVGPTLANALRMGNNITAQQPANPGTPANPNNPLNLPAELLTNYQAGFIPEKMFETQAAMFKPTDATIAARQAGVDPVTANKLALAKVTMTPELAPLVQAGFTPEQIHDYVAAKNAKDLVMAARPQQSLYGFGPDGRPDLLGVAADPVENMQFRVGPNGQVTAAPISGAVGSRSSMEGSVQGARERNTLHQVQVGNQTGVVWGGSVPGGGGGVGGGSGPTLSPMPPTAQLSPVGAPVAAPPAANRALPPGLWGQATPDATINNKAADIVAQLPQSYQDALQVKRSLENALQALQGTKSGQGAADAFRVTALLQNMGLPVAKDATENFQTLNKFLNNALMSAASVTGANRTDSSTDLFGHGQPNAETMNRGPLDKAIRYVLSQNDARLAAYGVINQAYQQRKKANDPMAASGAVNDWLGQYDPKVFEFNRMSPQDKAAFKAQMMRDKAAADAFGKKYNDFVSKGWVQ
jgi:hypothetical protein